MVNEPSAFEPLKFYCIRMHHKYDKGVYTLLFLYNNKISDLNVIYTFSQVILLFISSMTYIMLIIILASTDFIQNCNISHRNGGVFFCLFNQEPYNVIHDKYFNAEVQTLSLNSCSNMKKNSNMTLTFSPLSV